MKRFADLVGTASVGLSLFTGWFIIQYGENLNRCIKPVWFYYIVSWSFVITIIVIILGAILELGGREPRRAMFSLASVSILVICYFIWALTGGMRASDCVTCEGAAIAQLRTINTAEWTYASVHDGWATIDELVREGLLDKQFAPPGRVSGYQYKLVLGRDDYRATATRDAENCAAQWDFFSTKDAVIKYSTDPNRAPRGLAGRPPPTQ